MKQRATELEWLKYFHNKADFGPAHEDVMDIIKDNFMVETEKLLPEDYRRECAYCSELCDEEYCSQHCREQ